MARIPQLRDSRAGDPFRNYDTRECHCRDTGFSCDQGRKCPERMAQQRPKRTPRHLRPRSIVGQALAFIAVVLVVVLCVIAGAR